jgi:hypothetical protein
MKAEGLTKMRRVSSLILLPSSLIFFLLVPVITAQHSERRNSVFERSALADRTWPSYFKRLRMAVKRRDRATLKTLMVPDFHYSYGHHASNQTEDFREQAFKYWDEPVNDGWRALERTLANGAVPMAEWWREGRRQAPPSRVSPPAANIRRNLDRYLVSHIAVFEFENGRWYFTDFDVCCD